MIYIMAYSRKPAIYLFLCFKICYIASSDKPTRWGSQPAAAAAVLHRRHLHHGRQTCRRW